MSEMIIPEETWIKVNRYCDELRELNANWERKNVNQTAYIVRLLEGTKELREMNAELLVYLQRARALISADVKQHWLPSVDAIDAVIAKAEKLK